MSNAAPQIDVSNYMSTVSPHTDVPNIAIPEINIYFLGEQTTYIDRRVTTINVGSHNRHDVNVQNSHNVMGEFFFCSDTNWN